MKQRGFTLIELLIAVAIVAILVAISIPQYQLILFKASRSEAKLLLNGMHKAETSSYGTFSKYTAELAEISPDLGQGGATRLGWSNSGVNVTGPGDAYIATVFKRYDDPLLVDTWIVKMNWPTFTTCEDAVPTNLIDGIHGVWVCMP